MPPSKLTSGQGKTAPSDFGQAKHIVSSPPLVVMTGCDIRQGSQRKADRFVGSRTGLPVLLTGTRELLNLRENEWRASHNASFAGDPLADRDSEQTSSRRGYRRSASKLRSIIRRTSVAASDALMSWQSAGRSSQWGTHATRSRRGRDIL